MMQRRSQKGAIHFMDNRKSILILTTDAGSGHRSAAEALEAAFGQLYGSAARVAVRNPWHHEQAPPIWRRYEQLYLEELQQAPGLYDLSYALSQLPGVAHLLNHGVSALLESTLRLVLEEYPADLIVSVYPLFHTAAAACYRDSAARPRLMSVATDLGALHRAWFSGGADLWTVPTTAGRRQAIRCGVDPRQVITAGMPVHLGFGTPRAPIARLRHELGWRPDLPALLLLGGGAGVGQIADLAAALDQADLPLQLAIVAGKNEALAERLRAYPWRIPTHIYGYLPLFDLMHAADIVATKAGGLTICEALAAGKPLLIHGVPPGQEAGNCRYVERGGAGRWTPDADALVSRLGDWLSDSAELERATIAARRLGRPNAAIRIARLGRTLLMEQPERARVRSRASRAYQPRLRVG
jgi:1,2-diacylglycerol 3-beta-galactosyltransferase